MPSFRRRQFLLTAGVAVGAALLKGCAINPPSPNYRDRRICAIDHCSGERLLYPSGMPEVKISKQASWGAARDNIEIGSSGGGIDGGQWQMPMPHLLSEGLITKGNRKVPMVVLAQLCTHGNGVAIAKKHKGKGIELDLVKSGGADYIKSLSTSDKKFKIAYTFPKVNQDFWLRYWLAANGIDPNKDVDLLAVPASQTVANMRTETMDGFSTGDPWPSRIVKDKIGFLAMLTADLWEAHPEEYLSVRREWVEQHPKAT